MIAQPHSRCAATIDHGDALNVPTLVLPDDGAVKALFAGLSVFAAGDANVSPLAEINMLNVLFAGTEKLKFPEASVIL